MLYAATVNERISNEELHTIVKNSVHNNINKLIQNNIPCPVLKQALEYSAISAGKMLRASLVFALNNDFDNQLLIDSATAIELIHTYSIVHDDLPAMDDDDFRRGKASCHKQFNEATAILVGDSLHSLAFEIISKHTNQAEQTLLIINILAKAIGCFGMVAGQSLELNQESGHSLKKELTNLSDENLIESIHHLKTGKLFTASLQIGAIIAGINSNSENFKLITQLGDKLGLAFQIQDDILDNTKSSIELGKPAGSDAKRKLPTYLSIHGVNKAKDILSSLWADCDVILNKLSCDKQQLKLLVDRIKSRQN